MSECKREIPSSEDGAGLIALELKEPQCSEDCNRMVCKLIRRAAQIAEAINLILVDIDVLGSDVANAIDNQSSPD